MDQEPHAIACRATSWSPKRARPDGNFRFFPVYSYLVVYSAGVRPVEMVRVLGAARDVVALIAGGYYCFVYFAVVEALQIELGVLRARRMPTTHFGEHFENLRV